MRTGNNQIALPFVVTIEVRTNLKFELLVSQHRRFIQYLEGMRARVLTRSFTRHNRLVPFDELTKLVNISYDPLKRLPVILLLA